MKNNVIIKAVGLRVRELRLARNLSQEELANEADIPLSQIGRIERGETNPTISTLYVLSQAFQIELKELVDVKFKKR